MMKMAEYKAPLRDMQFILNDVFNAPALWASMPGTEEASDDLAAAILEEGAKICENVLAPINRQGDEEGCQWQEGIVTTPSGFSTAYNTFAESGWAGLGGEPNYGGQGMPKMLTVMFEEMLYAANSSFALYPALTTGACLAINAHASDTLKALFLPKMYEGTWSGSMCLTEAHSGTDLGIIRTRAVPQDDGSYAVTGTKIFITGGDHDLTENIIHLVLAKLPDAPAGPRGISLFLVPKVKVDAEGNLGDSNQVSCGSIEHKMGIKGSSTCVMNFDGSQGYLVGDLNKGLAAMFTMMNYERLTIGLQGIGLADVSYQNALAYAKDRLQSRAPTGATHPDQIADPILVHPDVRRMLLTQKAYTEGCRAFAAFVGMKLDIAKHHSDDVVKSSASNMVALLTPIAKAYFTDRGFENCVLGQQVYGGHGYIREWGMEQFVRDARIAQIYEGTNGIQALDLIGRKVSANQGVWVKDFGAEIADYIIQMPQDAALAPFVTALNAANDLLQDTTDFVTTHSGEDKNFIGAASVDYLNLFGLVAMTFMWTRMAAAALPQADDPFCSGKLKTAHFFIQKLLPEAYAYQAKVKAGASTLMALSDDEF